MQRTGVGGRIKRRSPKHIRPFEEGFLEEVPPEMNFERKVRLCQEISKVRHSRWKNSLDKSTEA